jgi:hypothetical protein
LLGSFLSVCVARSSILVIAIPSPLPPVALVTHHINDRIQ